MKLQVLISCEHASNEVPEAYQPLFQHAEEDLRSHKGWDPGSLDIAQYLGDLLKVEPYVYPYTRLLIEPNRSPGHDQLYSDYSKALAENEKETLMLGFYQPFRDQVESAIEQLSGKGPVLHLGIHTFTPIWNNQKREVEIGVLFDPDRNYELKYAGLLCHHLSGRGYLIRENEPYLGIADGFITYLRTQFDAQSYLGFEIEVSQGLLPRLDAINDLLGKALLSASATFEIG